MIVTSWEKFGIRAERSVEVGEEGYGEAEEGGSKGYLNGIRGEERT